MYSIFHAWLHYGFTYRTIHFHHHREKHPFRGYHDAGNESPIEMGVALFLHLAAVRIVQTLMGVDWLSVYAHLSMKAIGSCINHVNHAVVIPLGFGVKIDVYHHRHHTQGTTHFAPFVPLIDRLFQSGRKGS